MSAAILPLPASISVPGNEAGIKAIMRAGFKGGSGEAVRIGSCDRRIVRDEHGVAPKTLQQRGGWDIADRLIGLHRYVVAPKR
jgi:hypothetical protein